MWPCGLRNGFVIYVLQNKAAFTFVHTFTCVSHYLFDVQSFDLHLELCFSPTYVSVLIGLKSYNHKSCLNQIILNTDYFKYWIYLFQIRL